MKKAAAYGSFYGAGTTEHGNTLGETLGNYAENMSVGAVGGSIGNYVGQQFFGRTLFPPMRNVYEQITGTAINKGYNVFKDKK